MSNRRRRDGYSGGFPDGFEPFDKLADPRKSRHPRHYFGEIIFIVLAAMICGSEGFAKARESWLRERLKLPGGLPTDDTFRRVFAVIDPDRFCECFASLVLAISGELRRQLIGIDGKNLRHSFENADPGTMLKQDTSIKDGLRGKRYRAALDESVLETILFPGRSK